MTTCCGARFTVIVRYNGEERATDLPLTTEMIRLLALEASARGLTISELVGELIATAAERGLFQQVLDQ